MAPLSATTIETAWALQGLWAAPWLSDVGGLDRAALVNHLLAMAVALSISALLLGALATGLRRRNVEPQAVVGAVAALFMTVQTALILRWPLPSYVLWCLIAAAGLESGRGVEPLPQHCQPRVNRRPARFCPSLAFPSKPVCGQVDEM